MPNPELVPPVEEKPPHPLRIVGVLLAWAGYGVWVGLRWLFEGRRGWALLALLLIGGWYGWEQRYHIAEEWGRIRGHYQGELELEREQARRSGQVIKDQQKELDSVK